MTRKSPPGERQARGKRRLSLGPDGEVFLRRLQPDEALARLDTYLNRAFLQGLTRIRVVHGKGTGILRQLVRKELLAHPLVKSVRIAHEEEGGEGVTMIELEALK